jgi:hypothetical protein
MGSVEHLYFDLGVRDEGTRFEVTLRGSAANVYLLDVDQYQAYLDEDEFTYYGGFYDFSPFILEVPYDDHWYLVLDGNERQAKIEFVEIGD